MRLTSEVKIGFIGIVTLLAVIWGINFLKGKNILSSKNYYYACYDDIQGLESSANIIMRGYKVGTVDRIRFAPSEHPSFVVRMEIEKRYPVNEGSVAEIFSSDLLGTKAIRINLSEQATTHAPGDTLQSGIEPELLSGILEEISPVIRGIEQLARTLDSVGNSIYRVVNDQSFSGTLSNLEAVSDHLASTLSEQGELSSAFGNIESITAGIRLQNDTIAATIQNLKQISDRINTDALDTTMATIAMLSMRLEQVMSTIEKGEGSLGKLIYNDSLYDHITALSSSLDSLVQDIQKHPGSYVRFSVFGK
jgi:phospholipid/cholesterol/gamma-HCH transport system substrate-binding protein